MQGLVDVYACEGLSGVEWQTSYKVARTRLHAAVRSHPWRPGAQPYGGVCLYLCVRHE